MKTSPGPLLFVLSCRAHRCWVRVCGDTAASGVRIKQMGANLFGSTWGEGKVWLSQFGGLSAWSSASLHCPCLHGLNLPHHAWDWCGAHADHLPYGPQVWGCWWQMFLPFPLCFFSSCQSLKGRFSLCVNAEQWHVPAGPKGWGVICRYIQIQALQNSLSCPLVIPVMGGSVFRKGFSCFGSAVFYMECAICIFCTQGKRGSGTVRTMPKELL